GSLAQRLSGAPLAAVEAAKLVAMLARAIQFAHEHGVVHRDLKPANILVPTNYKDQKMDYQRAKITDFGLARWLDRESSNTASNPVMETPSYMSPEQADPGRSRSAPASDIYSLGAILYELMTGRPPFDAGSPLDTMLQVLHQEPIPPSRLRP